MSTEQKTTPNGLIALGRAPVGARVVVSRLEGGKRFAARLADMGVLPGAVLRVLREGGLGPVLVEVRGGRLVLGHGMADRILVRSRG